MKYSGTWLEHTRYDIRVCDPGVLWHFAALSLAAFDRRPNTPPNVTRSSFLRASVV